MTSPNPQDNNFTFKTENPINSIDKDLLNISNFSKYLAANIENYFEYNHESITIGLMGEWGSGKTSILNLTENYLDKSNIKIMKFNPWIYSSYNQLIEQFFNELIKQFYSKRDYDLGDNIKEYWFKINKSNLAKSILPTIISTKFKTLGKILKENTKFDSEEKSLEKLKDKINTKLLDYKIVCIIDDLDRVTSEEIQEMFRLVKIMADFYNIIYIISFDKKIVAKSLDSKYVNGKKYLEKIINISLDVPVITENELEIILKTNLIELSEKHEIELDGDRLDDILDEFDYETKKHYGILKFFKNMRDIKRFINVLEFNIELIKNEVNFIDFIAITSIQLFRPEIYEKIKYNETLLVKYVISKNEYDSNTELIKTEQHAFENIVKDDKNIKYLLQKLFPKMSFIYNTKYYSDYSDTYDSNLSICHPNHFNAYFKLNPNIKKITEEEITIIINLINSKKEFETIEQLKSLNENNKLELFFESIKNRTDNIREPEFFLKLIFSMHNTLTADIFNKNRYLLKKICLLLIIKINSNHRFNILKIEYKLMNHLNFLFELLIHIEKHNFIPNMQNEIILTEIQINQLKSIIKNKYHQMILKEFEYIETNLLEVLELGKDLELENDVNEIINILFSTDKGVITFLSYFMYPGMNNFIESEIRNISYYTNMEKIKMKIDENYDELKDLFEIKKFLKEYDIWKKNQQKFQSTLQ